MQPKKKNTHTHTHSHKNQDNPFVSSQLNTVLDSWEAHWTNRNKNIYTKEFKTN